MDSGFALTMTFFYFCFATFCGAVITTYPPAGVLDK